MVTGITRQLAEFIASISFDRLPVASIESVKRGVIDYIGVLFAGRNEVVVDIARAMAGVNDANAEARVLFDRGFAGAADAALINAIAGHALDYDDTAMDGHPSVVLVPAILAEGERLGVSGLDLIVAYVAGYETWAELSLRDEDRHHGKGWHPTAVFGTLAAAAAAARLARLDAGRTAHALGIAGSMASGLVANFGSMMKPFQVGRAAQNGVLAARLAAAGLTASPDALEHRSGLLQAVSPAGHVKVGGEIEAGRDWAILRYGVNIKRYPVCYAAHRVIDAMLGILQRQTLEAEQVGAIEVSMGKAQASMLRQHLPQTALDAKFSIEFSLASAIVKRHVGLEELNDAFVASAPIQSLMRKVRVTTIDTVDTEDPLFSPADLVRVTLNGGATLESEPVRRARGHAKNPISMEDLHAKYAACVGSSLAAPRRELLFERLQHLDALSNVDKLYGC